MSSSYSTLTPPFSPYAKYQPQHQAQHDTLSLLSDSSSQYSKDSEEREFSPVPFYEEGVKVIKNFEVPDLSEFRRKYKDNIEKSITSTRIDEDGFKIPSSPNSNQGSKFVNYSSYVPSTPTPTEIGTCYSICSTSILSGVQNSAISSYKYEESVKKVYKMPEDVKLWVQESPSANKSTSTFCDVLNYDVKKYKEFKQFLNNHYCKVTYSKKSRKN